MSLVCCDMCTSEVSTEAVERSLEAALCWIETVCRLCRWTSVLVSNAMVRVGRFETLYLIDS